MPFDPDIIVTGPDSCGPVLIAEAKLHEDLPGSESQLKKYMWKMSCTVGLLVFPRQVFIYRNRFTGYSDDSVVLIGPFSTPDSWKGFEYATSGLEFERAVQRWLTMIRTDLNSADVPPSTRQAFSEHVLPSLINGEIHAAGPRTRK